MNDILNFIGQLSHPLFQNLTSDDFKQLIKVSSSKTYKKGEVIIAEGEISSFVYIILSGKVSVTRKDETTKQIVNLATLSAKQVVGEISIVTSKPKSATVTAMVTTEVFVLDFAKIALMPTKQIYRRLLNNLAEEMAHKIVFATPKTTVELSPDEIFDDRYTQVPNSILVMFGWKWKDIIFEIPFLASHGFDAIKISPPQEFAVLKNRPWYEMYQPVSYHLSSSYGTSEDFRAMIDLCHSYKINVYVDLVINHMAGFPETEISHVGTNGTKFSKYHYGPLNDDNDFYEYDDFYHFQNEGNLNIQNEDYATFDKSWRVEHFDLNYLPKLNLDKPNVILVLRKYINYLLYLGVDGFRIDAAKHITVDSLIKILKGLKTRDGLNPFYYLEFYATFPAGIDPYSYMDKYYKIGYITSFSYADFVSDAIQSKNNNLEKLVQYSFGASWVNFPENRSVVLIDNHDTERMMPHLLSYKNTGNNSYVLSYIFMLAWPFGIPKIMSSFRFSNFDDSIPKTSVWQNGKNSCFEQKCPWVCQHRWVAISNMVLFRKKTQNAKGITHVWANKDQIAFARSCQKTKESVYALGFVVINNSAEKLSRKFETGLPAGDYFNLINSGLVEGKMRGQIINVSDYGAAVISINPFDAVVICLDFVE